MTRQNNRTQTSIVNPDEFVSAIDKPWKTIVLLSTIVVAVVLALLTIVGWLGKSKYTPQIIDHAFGISSYIDQRMAQHYSDDIDSGYSEFFDISPATAEDKYITSFYSTSNQEVSVTVTGEAPGRLSRATIPVTILVDNQPWTKIRIPDLQNSFRYRGSVTRILNASDLPFRNIHSIRLVPDSMSAGDEVFVRTLVLVSNNPPKS